MHSSLHAESLMISRLVSHASRRVVNGTLAILVLTTTASLSAQSNRHVASVTTFAPRQEITIRATVEFADTAQALGYSVTIPPGWTFLRTSGNAGDIGPKVGTTEQLEWAWTRPLRSPVVFSYTVRAAEVGHGAAVVSAEALLRQKRTLRVIPASNLTLKPKE